MRDRHYRVKLFNRFISLQIDKSIGDRYKFGLNFIYDSTIKSCSIHASLGLYTTFFMVH